MDFIGRGAPLSDSGVDAVAARLRVERAALWAVITVETSGFGFQTDRRPKILFERHVFEQQTGGRFSSAAPELSNSEPGGYGRPGAEQYARLERAMAFDRRAALRSASWGLGQVMGYHAETLGYPDVEVMVRAMTESEDRQLEAMERFIVHGGLDRAMRERHWPRSRCGTTAGISRRTSTTRSSSAATPSWSPRACPTCGCEPPRRTSPIEASIRGRSTA